MDWEEYRTQLEERENEIEEEEYKNNKIEIRYKKFMKIIKSTALKIKERGKKGNKKTEEKREGQK